MVNRHHVARHAVRCPVLSPAGLEGSFRGTNRGTGPVVRVETAYAADYLEVGVTGLEPVTSAV